MLVVFFSFTVLANLIAAPFNGLLAEKVEKSLGGDIPSEDTEWKALVADIIPSILVELRKLSYFLLRAIPLLILFLIAAGTGLGSTGAVLLACRRMFDERQRFRFDRISAE